MSGADATFDERDDDVAAAAEYVLGLLPPPEAQAFEARLAADPEARALVALWTEDLASLADAVPGVAPPRGLEAAVMRRLFPDERRGWLARLGLVPAAVGALAAALLVLWLAVPGIFAPTFEPTLAAEVAAEDGSLVLRAAYDPAAGLLRVERVAGETPEGRARELWLIAGDAPPASLGVLPPDLEADVPVPEALRPGVAGGTLAVSDEAPGGSTTGSPGTVLALGPITEL